MSTAAAPTGVPAGQHAPFAVVTDTDHAAWIIVATALALSWSLLFGGIRLFMRIKVSPGFKLDDILLGVSTAFAIIQSALVLSACADGLGKSIALLSLDRQVTVQKKYYASNLFFLLSLGLSKLSVIFFLLRLTPAKRHKQVFYVVAALVALWMVASVFALAFQCNLAHPWILVGERCPNADLRWRVIGAFDLLSEPVIVGMVVYLVWGLRTSFMGKVSIVATFGARLPMVLCVVFRLVTFDEVGWTANPTLREASFIAWTQAELNFSLISATVACVRPFVRDFTTHFGGLGQNSQGYGYGSGYRLGSGHRTGNDGGYKLSTLKSGTGGDAPGEPRSNGAATVPTHNQIFGAELNAPKVTYCEPEPGLAAEHKVKGDSNSVDSDDSRQMIIRKDVTWDVQHVVRRES